MMVVKDNDSIIETRKIIKIGNSYGISIPKHELDKRGIAKGDEVIINLALRKKETEYTVSPEMINDIQSSINDYQAVLERLSDYDTDKG